MDGCGNGGGGVNGGDGNELVMEGGDHPWRSKWPGGGEQRPAARGRMRVRRTAWRAEESMCSSIVVAMIVVVIGQMLVTYGVQADESMDNDDGRRGHDNDNGKQKLRIYVEHKHEAFSDADAYHRDGNQCWMTGLPKELRIHIHAAESIAHHSICLRIWAEVGVDEVWYYDISPSATQRMQAQQTVCYNKSKLNTLHDGSVIAAFHTEHLIHMLLHSTPTWKRTHTFDFSDSAFGLLHVILEDSVGNALTAPTTAYFRLGEDESEWQALVHSMFEKMNAKVAFMNNVHGSEEERQEQSQKEQIRLDTTTHAQIRSMDNTLVDPTLRTVVDTLKRSGSSRPLLENEAFERVANGTAVKIHKAFTDDAIRLLIEYIAEAKSIAIAKNMSLRRPNDMNNYGLIMKDIGLHDAIEKFALHYLMPIAVFAFPDWIERDDIIDSIHAFTVDYRLGEDVSLPVSCPYLLLSFILDWFEIILY